MVNKRNIVITVGALVLIGTSGVGINALKEHNLHQQTNVVAQNQPQPKYKVKSSSADEINRLVKGQFLTSSKSLLDEINHNQKAYLLILPNNDSYYQNNQSVPTTDTLQQIIKQLKQTNKKCYALTENQVQMMNSSIMNAQEKQQTQSTTPFMLIYFNPDNGKTSCTTLTSSVDTQRKMVLQQTLSWIKQTNNS